jgi:peptidyl-prolyl cis-trans isomerase C
MGSVPSLGASVGVPQHEGTTVMVQISSRIVGLIAVFCLPLVAHSICAAEPAAKVSDPVVVEVDGTKFRLSDVADAFTRIPTQYAQVPIATLYSAVLDNLINTHLMSVAARKAKLYQTPAVKEQLARVEAEILQRAYLATSIDSRLTDDAVKKRYEQINPNLNGDELISARHILVDSEVKAKEIIAELAKNSDFAAMARKYSKGPSTAKGGDLGYFSRDAMVAPFSTAAFALKDGEITKTPVKSDFGWHIIKVEGRRFAAPPSYEQMRPKLADDMAQEIGGRIIADLRALAKIERFQIDPAALGTMLGK